MSQNSLSSVVSGLVRAQVGSSVPSTVTDEDLDRHVAELILKEAKRKAERYASQGIRAFLPETSNAPKTNKRFLSSIIRNTDDHNKTILRAQAQAAQEIKQQREEEERRERRVRAEEAAEAQRLRRRARDSSRDGWRSSKRRERSWERRDDYDDDYDRERRRKSSRRHRHGDDHSRRHHSSRHKRSHSSDRSDDEDRRSKEGSEEDEERHSRRRRDKKRARSISEDSRYNRRKDRRDEKKSARLRSPLPSDSEDSRPHPRRDREPSKRMSGNATDDDRTPGPSRKSSKSRSRSRELHKASTTSSRRPASPHSDEAVREAELRSKLKGKGKAREEDLPSDSRKKNSSRSTRVKSPSRSPHPSPGPRIESKMDKYFETSYDPRLDVEPLKVPDIPATGLIDDTAFEGWDAMLKVIEMRRQDKVEKKWLAKHGIKEEKKTGTSSTERWDSGPSVMDIEYKKRGHVREWDLCKETPT
ncbi:hypothetical protein OE88DRAFT_1649672 [Heliocybe sulcata]|uniref:Uncharacterized protein n=1 Tax=Heliocybe sulcata TaxID=5364 RepID=A0A5C3NER5_9AGAM|nr:hypothetical protein OE88DRAFT_1649672 [Heliocybe sulcata]